MLLVGEFLASVGVMIFDVNQNSLMLMLIPHEVRSRVVGVSRFFNYGTRPFGALLGGVLGAAIGLRPTLWVGGHRLPVRRPVPPGLADAPHAGGGTSREPSRRSSGTGPLRALARRGGRSRRRARR